MQRQQREAHVDALRALALLGVFMVNGMGYALGPDYPAPIGAPTPAHSPIAQALHALAFALFQGKAWPFLCFLLGSSMQRMASRALARGTPARAALHGRYLKLLFIGVLHGVFVYHGDVLSQYALVALVALIWAQPVGAARVRLSRLRRVARMWALVAALILFLSIFGAAAYMLDAPLPPVPRPPSLTAEHHGMPLERLTAQAPNYGAFWSINANNFGITLLGLVMFAPVLIWLTLCGMLAQRLRLLRPGRVARQFWGARFGLAQLGLSTGAVLALGVASAYSASSGQSSLCSLVSGLSIPAGIWWVACLLSAHFRTRARADTPAWVAWLAPAGRHTLAMYLCLSVLLMFSGNAWLGGLGNGALLRGMAQTAISLPVLALLWLAAVLLARRASAKGLRDPLARWLSGPKGTAP